MAVPIVAARDRALVREGVEQAAAGVDQRDAVGRAVLGIGLDDEVRARGERAAERAPQVLVAGAAVDEHQRDARQVGRTVSGVVDLDEPAAVGADLVVVDFVEHELGPGRRGRRRPVLRLAGQHDRAVDLRLDRDRRRACRRSSCSRSRRGPRSSRSSRLPDPGGPCRPARTGRPRLSARAWLACRARRPGRAGGTGLALRAGRPAGPCTFQLNACSERLHALPAEGISRMPDLCRHALITPSSSAAASSPAVAPPTVSASATTPSATARSVNLRIRLVIVPPRDLGGTVIAGAAAHD